MERKRQRDLAALPSAFDSRIELAEEAHLALLAEAHHVARLELARRLDEGTPARAVEALMERRLDRRLGSGAPDAPAVQGRGDYLRVVDHDLITRREQPRQLADRTVF